MDTITHTVIGICEGELIAGKKLGKRAMLWGALANNAPDLDVFTRFWMHEPNTLLAHRGFLHSILFGLIFSPLVAYVFRKIFKNKPVSFAQWLLLFACGFFTHIFIDAFTTYGTGWFEPFSHVRVAFNTLFIIDPLFSIPVLIGAIVIIVLKRTSAKRTAWAKWALIVSTIYFTLAGINKLYIDHVVEKSLAAQHIKYNDYMAAPTPLNNLLWYIVAKNDSSLYIGYYSLFDANTYITYQTLPRNTFLQHETGIKSSLDKLIRFSDDYYTLNRGDSSIIFSDARFGQDGGWYKNNAPFAFSFVLQSNNKNPTRLKARFNSANKQGVLMLLKRIEGIDQTKK